MQRALEIVGGRTLLCAKLAAAPRELEAWLDGRQPIPHEIFELATEIVLQDDLAWASDDRRAEPRAA